MTTHQLALLIAEAAAPEVGLRSGLGIDHITRYLKGESVPLDHGRKIDQAVGNILVTPPPKLRNGCIAKLECEKENLRIKIREMETRESGLKNTIRELESDLERTSNQLAKEEETVYRLQRTIESTQTRNNSLQEEVKVLKKNNRDRGVQIDKLAARVRNQQEVIDKLNLEFHLHEPSVVHEAKIAGLLHEISHLRNYIEKTNQPQKDARV